MSHFPCTYFGNKRLEIKEFEAYLIKPETKTIIEPFAGTCAVSFYLNQKYPERFNFIAYDSSPEVIRIYKALEQIDGEFYSQELIDAIAGIMKTWAWRHGRKNKTTETKFTKKQLEFIKFIKSDKFKFIGADWKTDIDELASNPENSIFLDPPYFDSYNQCYFTETKIFKSAGNNSAVSMDLTFIFCEICELFKKGSAANILMISSSVSILRYIFRDFIANIYEVTTGINCLKLDGKFCKKKRYHIIVTNWQP